MKTILKFILYAGAIACCLVGLGTTYFVLRNLNENAHDDWYALALVAVYICLSFTPCVIFLTGWKTKTWQWVLIATVEFLVLALVLYAQLAIATL